MRIILALAAFCGGTMTFYSYTVLSLYATDSLIVGVGSAAIIGLLCVFIDATEQPNSNNAVRQTRNNAAPKRGQQLALAKDEQQALAKGQQQAAFFPRTRIVVPPRKNRTNHIPDAEHADMEHGMSYKNELGHINTVTERVGFRVTNGALTHRSIAYEVQQAHGARIGALRTALQDIANAVYKYRSSNGVTEPVKLSLVEQPLSIVAPRVDPQILDWSKRTTLDTQWNTSLGVRYIGEHRQDVALDLDSPDQFSILLGATSGAGKSMLLDGMVLSAAESNDTDKLHIIIIDIGNKHFGKFQTLPHIVSYADELSDALAILRHVEQAMHGPENEYTHRTLVVLDEIQMLTRGGDVQLNTEFKRLLTNIAGRGRAYGYSIIISTQKPMASIVPSEVRDNCVARIAGRCESSGQSSMILGDDSATSLTGVGNFIFRGQIFDSFYIDDVASEVARIGNMYEPAPWIGIPVDYDDEATDLPVVADGSALVAERAAKLMPVFDQLYDCDKQKWIYRKKQVAHDLIFGEGNWHSNSHYGKQVDEVAQYIINNQQNNKQTDDLVWILPANEQ